jgi:hypothetical protein
MGGGTIRYPPPHMHVSSSSYACILLLICMYPPPHMHVSSSSYACILLLICMYPPPHMNEVLSQREMGGGTIRGAGKSPAH